MTKADIERLEKVLGPNHEKVIAAKEEAAEQAAWDNMSPLQRREHLRRERERVADAKAYWAKEIKATRRPMMVTWEPMPRRRAR